MRNQPNEPYQDLPPLPPTAEVETYAVLKANVDASRALARLTGTCRRLAERDMLLNVILLLEAQASSEIENILVTQEELFKAGNHALPAPSSSVRKVLRYRDALLSGVRFLKRGPLGVETVLDLGKIIAPEKGRVRTLPGTFIGNPVTKERVYTPPQGEEVLLKHLSAWENFLHDDHGIDPMIAMALAHYQFEAIHPFSDGNGRTGRVLNILLLIEAGLLELPVLYLSGYIVRHKDTYYERLNAVTREEAWESWILFMLDGIRSTAQWTLQLMETSEELRAEMEESNREVGNHLPAAELTRLLFSQPYLRIENLVEAGLAKRQTASVWLGKLVEAKLIGVEKMGRQKVFINHRLVDPLFHTPLPE